MNAEIIPLASRLRQRREELGLTQAQAARQLDVARTAYRLWEMEAAKPAPDRWRAIAQWLGISMTVMLLAEELIDERDALAANRAATGGGLTDTQWDAATDAATLSRVLARIQLGSSSNTVSAWHPGQFRKRFSNDTLAPALARAALATTAIGIQVDAFDAGSVLVSELVTNSVKHSQSDWIEVAITLTRDVLRIEVSDQDRHTIRPRTPDLDGGWGLTLVGELATRWGVERRSVGKTVWVEFDLEPST